MSAHGADHHRRKDKFIEARNLAMGDILELINLATMVSLANPEDLRVSAAKPMCDETHPTKQRRISLAFKTEVVQHMAKSQGAGLRSTKAAPRRNLAAAQSVFRGARIH